MSRDRQLRTQYSAAALDFSEMFTGTLGKLRLPPGNYAPDLPPPEGPSTAGGAQAMQPLRLVPPNPAQPALLVGQINVKDRTAEIRDFHYVDAVHRQRFGVPVSIHQAEYAEFVRRVLALCEVARIEPRVVGPPSDLGEPPPETVLVPRASGNAIGIIVAVVVIGILAVVAGVAAYFLA